MNKTKYTNAINNIFNTISIHKSLIVCHNDYKNKLYINLLENDYPISTLMELHKFNSNQNRILLIDEIDAEYISTISSQINFEYINLILYVNVNFKISGLEKLNSIFL